LVGTGSASLKQVGVAALSRAIRQPEVAVLVIDEIGKMELLSPAFREVVLAGLDGPKSVLGTVTTARIHWVDAVKSRPDVTLMEVTLANRSALPALVLDWLEEDRGR
jgi:nucleoside-triphosphatase